MENTGYQLTSTMRHLRLLFFIDISYPYPKLYQLIERNLALWGGRYNPIIPVENDSISESYLQLMPFFDPDIVYYSEGVSFAKIHDLGLFSTAQFQPLEPNSYLGTTRLAGLNALSPANLYDSNTIVYSTNDLFAKDNMLYSYFKLNYGIGNISHPDKFYLSKVNHVNFSAKDYASVLNYKMYNNKHLKLSTLARSQTNSKWFRKEDATDDAYMDVEIVVSALPDSRIDLIYFWNRLFFECTDVIFISAEQLELLRQDQYFYYELVARAVTDNVLVTSYSMASEALEAIVTKLNINPSGLTFLKTNAPDFPFKVLSLVPAYPHLGEEKPSVQILSTKKSIYFPPQRSFDNLSIYDPVAIDIKIKKANSYESGNGYVLFPSVTDTRLVFPDVLGRINSQKSISVQLNRYSPQNLTINVLAFLN